jgi:dsDNA-specific endonuclease/ATPase MutS2
MLKLFREIRQRLRPSQSPRTNKAIEKDFEIEEFAEEEIDPFNPFPSPIKLEIGDVFDLHTIEPRDVRPVVEEYLTQAHHKNFRSVRIIHGKGKFVQRAVVHKILARTSFVRAWTDAPPEAGGVGATVVHFRIGEDSIDS